MKEVNRMGKIRILVTPWSRPGTKVNDRNAAAVNIVNIFILEVFRKYAVMGAKRLPELSLSDRHPTPAPTQFLALYK
jgi:hypothetical protein